MLGLLWKRKYLIQCTESTARLHWMQMYEYERSRWKAWKVKNLIPNSKSNLCSCKLVHSKEKKEHNQGQNVCFPSFGLLSYSTVRHWIMRCIRKKIESGLNRMLCLLRRVPLRHNNVSNRDECPGLVSTKIAFSVKRIQNRKNAEHWWWEHSKCRRVTWTYVAHRHTALVHSRILFTVHIIGT